MRKEKHSIFIIMLSLKLGSHMYVCMYACSHIHIHTCMHIHRYIARKGDRIMLKSASFGVESHVTSSRLKT